MTPSRSRRCRMEAALSRPASSATPDSRRQHCSGAQLDAFGNTGKSASVRIYAPRIRSRIVANREAGIGGLGNSEYSGILVFGYAPDLRCRRFAAAGSAGQRQCRIHDFGDSIRRQLFMAARPSQHETRRRLAIRASRCPAAAQSDRFVSVHQHSDEPTCRLPERR